MGHSEWGRIWGRIILLFIVELSEFKYVWMNTYKIIEFYTFFIGFCLWIFKVVSRWPCRSQWHWKHFHTQFNFCEWGNATKLSYKVWSIGVNCDRCTFIKQTCKIKLFNGIVRIEIRILSLPEQLFPLICILYIYVSSHAYPSCIQLLYFDCCFTNILRFSWTRGYTYLTLFFVISHL